MDQVLTVVAFVKAHLSDITNLVAYVIAIASIVVRFTPTLADDNVLQKVKDFVGKYIALNPPKN